MRDSIIIVIILLLNHQAANAGHAMSAKYAFRSSKLAPLTSSKPHFTPKKDKIMKQLHVQIKLWCLLLCLLPVACHNPEVNAPEEQFQQLDETADVPFSGDVLFVPEGSRLEQRAAEDFVRFELPEGYAFVGKDERGEPFLIVEPVGVICTCLDGGGGCSPVRRGSNFDCLMTTCGNCRKEAYRLSGEGKQKFELLGVVYKGKAEEALSLFGDKEPPVLRIVSVGADEQAARQLSFMEGFALVSAGLLEQDKLIPAPFHKEYLDLPGVRAAVNEWAENLKTAGWNEEMQKHFAATGELPKGFVLVKAAIYGIPVALVTPQGNDLNRWALLKRAAGVVEIEGGVKCSCLKGGSVCPKNSMLGVVYCDASNCKSCKME